jgi:hypothetical protein
MRKRKSTRETKNMIQTALWLPRDMHERLKKEGGERGLGEEIRRLIDEGMQAADAARTPDENTHELLDLIKEIADLALEEPWYADRFAFDVFKAAINTLLSRYQPSGEAKQETRAKFQGTWGDENPETIGRMIARVAMHAHARERYGQEIVDKLKERKG